MGRSAAEERRNMAGLELEKDAAERISQREENMSRARKSPAWGVRGAPGVKRG